MKNQRVQSTQRLRCSICGLDTADAIDYVEASLSTEHSTGFQVLGMHAACLNEFLAAGFRVEVHLFGGEAPNDS